MQNAELSIILPTYNRASFLPQAFDSIRAQTYTDWELIVVDDGSTDETRDIMPSLSRCVPQDVQCIHQENCGPAAARNAGLRLARGKYIAFFDSDDRWLPEHLLRCVDALRANSDVDWVFAACRLVDHTTGEVIRPNHFYEDGKAEPFLHLTTQARGELRVINDPQLSTCAIQHGICCGLQHSVMRATIFDDGDMPLHSVGEDRLLAIRSTVLGRRFAYFPDVHVIYNVHADNISAPSRESGFEKLVATHTTLVRGYESLPQLVPLNRCEHKALHRRLAREYFWHLGYPLLEAGRRAEALAMFRRGLAHNPLDPSYWKTYLLAEIRRFLGLHPSAHES